MRPGRGSGPDPGGGSSAGPAPAGQGSAGITDLPYASIVASLASCIA